MEKKEIKAIALILGLVGLVLFLAFDLIPRGRLIYAYIKTMNADLDLPPGYLPKKQVITSKPSEEEMKIIRLPQGHFSIPVNLAEGLVVETKDSQSDGIYTRVNRPDGERLLYLVHMSAASTETLETSTPSIGNENKPDPTTSYEFWERVLSERPLSFWQMLFLPKKKLVERLSILLLKRTSPPPTAISVTNFAALHTKGFIWEMSAKHSLEIWNTNETSFIWVVCKDKSNTILPYFLETFQLAGLKELPPDPNKPYPTEYTIYPQKNSIRNTPLERIPLPGDKAEKAEKDDTR